MGVWRRLNFSTFAFSFITFSIFHLNGCATTRAPLAGILYSLGESGLVATANPSGNRMGESCMVSILGLVAIGDASIESARRNGGITQITSVDERTTHILGFVYSKFCTAVRGK